MKAKTVTIVLAIVLPVLGSFSCDASSPPDPPPTKHSLTVQVFPANGGSVTRSPDQAQYESGSLVTLTAAPASGFTFSHWQGDASGTANPTTVTMNAYKTVTAVFTPIAQYTLTAVSSPSNGGVVSRSPDQAQYASGAVVTLTAAPAADYAFSHWEGDASGTDNPATVTMSGDKTVTAVFVSTAQYTLAITITPSAGGDVSRSPDQAQYISGAVVTLTAAPAVGYAFSHWEGDASGTDNPTTVTMGANRAVTAVFISTAQYTLAITSTPPAGGDVSRSPDQAQYASGAVVTLTAAPAVGYAFSHWDGDASGSDNPTTVTMDADKTVTAVFVSTAQYTLDIESAPSAGGSVSRSPDQAQYATGTLVTLTAAPAAGYAFSHWEGDASGTDNPTTVVMDADKIATAVFAVPPFGVPAIERRALIALYSSTIGDGWTDNSGWKTPPLDPDGFALPGTESAWFGVTADPGTKHVIRISLAGNNLIGTIPPEIGDLAGLQSLQMSSNRLTGPIPGEIGLLVKLNQLSLAENQLTGPIPPEIGNMSQLGYLFLFRNRLSGSIPVQLGALPHLRQMHIYSNQLSGPIPPELANSTSLQWIVLRDNQLSGEIPPELGRMTDLRVLRLGDNQLTGTIPPELGNLVNLQSFRLRNNHLGGQIPDTLGNLTQLWELLLDANQFSGPIPTSFTNLTALTATNIGYNALHTSDEALIAFLDDKDPNWAETQTIAPAQVTATPLDNGVILVSWLPVAYTADPGYFKVLISETEGGPYTLAGQTADKEALSVPVTGLAPGARYYFVVQTHTDVHLGNTNAVDSDYSAEVSAVALPQALRIVSR